MPESEGAVGRKRSGQAADEKEKDEEKDEEQMDLDDKLYCVCQTSYDEDRVMIACDR